MSADNHREDLKSKLATFYMKRGGVVTVMSASVYTTQLCSSTGTIGSFSTSSLPTVRNAMQ